MNAIAHSEFSKLVLRQPLNLCRLRFATCHTMPPLSVTVRSHVQVKALMKQAFEAGVNFFDNAEVFAAFPAFSELPGASAL